MKYATLLSILRYGTAILFILPILCLISCEEHYTKCVIRCTDTSHGIKEYYIYDAHMMTYDRTDRYSYQIDDSIRMLDFGIYIKFEEGVFIIEDPEISCCGYEYQVGETLVDFQLDVINTETEERFNAIPFFFMDYPNAYELPTLEEFLKGKVSSSFSIKLEPDTLIPLSALFEANITISDEEKYLVKSDTILFKKITDSTYLK